MYVRISEVIHRQVVSCSTRFDRQVQVLEVLPCLSAGQGAVLQDQDLLICYRIGGREVYGLLPLVGHGETGSTDIVLLGGNCVNDGVELHEVEVDIEVHSVSDGLPDVHVDSLVALGDHVVIGREIRIRGHLDSGLHLPGDIMHQDIQFR